MGWPIAEHAYPITASSWDWGKPLLRSSFTMFRRIFKAGWTDADRLAQSVDEIQSGKCLVIGVRESRSIAAYDNWSEQDDTR
jgi:hypothetical protein